MVTRPTLKSFLLQMKTLQRQEGIHGLQTQPFFLQIATVNQFLYTTTLVLCKAFFCGGGQPASFRSGEWYLQAVGLSIGLFPLVTHNFSPLMSFLRPFWVGFLLESKLQINTVKKDSGFPGMSLTKLYLAGNNYGKNANLF